MFIVKAMFFHCGAAELSEAHSVKIRPYVPPMTAGVPRSIDDPQYEVWLYDEAGVGKQTIYVGVAKQGSEEHPETRASEVFIMNENGKTVETVRCYSEDMKALRQGGPKAR